MPSFFQIDASCGEARTGKLNTPHGAVETPVFMPVGTLGTVKGVPQDVLEELGVDILLSNTYHLYLRPGVEQIRNLDGDYAFETFISLTCHNCPEVVQALNAMSVINPRIKVTTIDGGRWASESRRTFSPARPVRWPPASTDATRCRAAQL